MSLKYVMGILRANRATCERVVAKWLIINGKESTFAATHCPAYGRRCAMKIKNGKIVEATVSELFDRWLSSDHCEIYPFDYYKWLCKELGAKIVDEEVCDAD